MELSALSPEDVAVLRGLLAEHGVLLFADQSLDDDAFVAFLRSFGELTFTKGETHVDGHPDLNAVSNVGRATLPKSAFHVDTSYVRDPLAYTALRAVQIPERGGATQFTNQYRAYETLPDDVRTLLDGRAITHVVTGLELGTDDETSAEHPVFRPHPLTGRVALYLALPTTRPPPTEAPIVSPSRLLDQSVRDHAATRVSPVPRVAQRAMMTYGKLGA